MGLFHRCSPSKYNLSWRGTRSLAIRTYCKCGEILLAHTYDLEKEVWNEIGKLNGWTLGSSAPVSPPWGELLGVKPNASKAQVDKAHREIARIVHPDVGGTSHLMTLFNNAKDAAYKQLRFK